MANPPPQRHLLSPPELPDDLIPEILIRVPPHTPALLIRCSAVCKAWRRLLTSAAFLRRYRAFHGAAPFLGFLFNPSSLPNDLIGARFVPATPFLPRARALLDCYAHDARHGRVLLHTRSSSAGRGTAIVVWDPVTDEQRELPMPDVPFKQWDATVLCAAHARGCDHLHCRGGPFLVAFVGATSEGLASACVYSSEADAWGDATAGEHPDAEPRMAMRPSALVGNTVYFVTSWGTTLVEYDLGSRRLAFIDTPFMDDAFVMPWEGGKLGFAIVRAHSLLLFSRDVHPDGTATWMQRRVIELNTLPTRDLGHSLTAVGFAEGLGIVFVSSDAGVCAVSLKSDRIKKVFSRGSIYTVIPYMSFYTPDHAAG